MHFDPHAPTADGTPVDNTPTDDTPEDGIPADQSPAVLSARSLSVTGPRGPVYGPVDLDLHAGTLTAAAGPHGSGRTSLLLTLAGRMRPTTGKLSWDGRPVGRSLRQVRSRVALGELTGVNDLDPALTVEEHLRECLALHRPWPRDRGRGREAIDAALATVTEAVGIRRSIPPNALVRDLTPADRYRLGLALALITSPAVLAVDDIERNGSATDVLRSWDLLYRIAAAPGGPAVIAACLDAPPEVRVVDLIPVRVAAQVAAETFHDSPPEHTS